MTRCPSGAHAFPIEDGTGAYCPEHGMTLVFNWPPITEDDVPNLVVPCEPCLLARVIGGDHACANPGPCPCTCQTRTGQP